MVEISQDKRREGLELANAVTMLAVTAPSGYAERRLHLAAQDLRRHFGYSWELKKAQVLSCVKKEPLGITIADLKKEINFHERDVYELVKDLEKEKKITCHDAPPAGSRGGRPTLIVKAA